jgi:hypothetical protein
MHVTLAIIEKKQNRKFQTHPCHAAEKSNLVPERKRNTSLGRNEIGQPNQNRKIF